MNFASPEALGALAVMIAGWACRETLFQWWRRRFSPESAASMQNDSRRGEPSTASTMRKASRRSVPNS